MMQNMTTSIGQKNGQIIGEFHQHLAAGATRRCECICLCNDDQGLQFPRFHALGHSGTDSRALGAGTHRIAGVLHIASGNNGAAMGAQGGSHLEVGIGGMGMLSRLPSGSQESIPIGGRKKVEGHGLDSGDNPIGGVGLPA